MKKLRAARLRAIKFRFELLAEVACHAWGDYAGKLAAQEKRWEKLMRRHGAWHLPR